MGEGADQGRECEVFAALGRVDQMGRAIFATVETLSKRLKPVLRPSNRATNKEEPKEEMSAVPMAAKLNEIADGLTRAGGNLEAILETLEV